MKKIAYVFLSVFVLISTLTNSQNVGINSTGAVADASAGLDVSFTDKGFLAPKVALTAANTAGPITLPATGLLVYNTATAGAGQNQVWPGYYYNTGTPAAPLWVRFDGRMMFKASATAGITTSPGTFTTIPGTAITFTIPAGKSADVYIWAYAGAMESANQNNNYATVDIAIFQNGAFLNIGGFNRITLDGNLINEFKTTSFVTRETLSAGTYTYDIRGRRAGGTAAINIGGNCATDVNCGEMIIEVIFR